MSGEESKCNGHKQNAIKNKPHSFLPIMIVSEICLAVPKNTASIDISLQSEQESGAKKTKHFITIQV